MTWSFRPVVSGTWRMASWSSPQTQAAVARVKAAAAPEVTSADSAPTSDAMRWPAASCSSWSETYCLDACSMAATTSSGMSDADSAV